MDEDRLDAIDRDLSDAERTLDQLEDGTRWTGDDDVDDVDDEPSFASAETADAAADVTVELDPDVTAQLSPARPR